MHQPIDYEHLAKYTGGDVDLEIEVFEMFREQTQMWLRLLNPQAAPEDWRSAAHSLKGSARGIGAFALAQCCEQAEAAAEATATARALIAEEVRCAAEHVLDAAASRDYRREIDGLRYRG